jgi:hypothetical protein
VDVPDLVDSMIETMRAHPTTTARPQA